MGQSQSDIAARISERQMRLWNALHPPEHWANENVRKVPYRFITVSRDDGSLGNEIASLLASRLNWHVFDREIVNYIAENNHVREDLVRQLDEKSQGLVHEAILRLLRMPESASFGSEEYHESLLKTLATVATRGNAVLVGRGANFALRWMNDGLHVRITGSFDTRLRRECERLRMPVEKVRSELAAKDADRRHFIRHHFRNDFDDPRSYDLIFNTDALSVDQIVNAIIATANPAQPLVETRVA